MKICLHKPFPLFALILMISCKDSPEIVFPNHGYDFPKSVSSPDSNEFYYPIKNQLSTRDSFLNYQEHFFFNAFDEENLSIKPTSVPTVRFVYGGGLDYPVIIRMIPNAILIKKAFKGNFYPNYDYSKLTSIEKLHLSYLKSFFGIDNIDSHIPRWKKWDSLTKVYPKLRDAAYYNYLLTKAEIPNTDPLQYHTTRISISDKTYFKLIKAINESDFWNGKLKRDCVVDWTDGTGYALEINTGKKYNVIFSTIGCPDNETKITKVCQDMINLCGLGKDIQVFNMEIK